MERGGAQGELPTSTPEEAAGPPQAPPGPRRPRMSWTQRIGMAVLSVPVILALLGIIGEQKVTVQAEGAGVRVEVEYPKRLRHHVEVNVRIRVRNVGRAPLESVRVSLSPEYLQAFDDVRVSPSEVSPGAIDVGTMSPGASRDVELQLRGARSFAQRGQVRVAASGADRAHVELRSWVWP